MLDVLLKAHRDAHSVDYENIWENGLFVFDANVLLDLYRLPESASNDLIGVLRDKKLNSRVWIGFQVLVEFLNNRHEAIGDQKNKFNTVREILQKAVVEYDEVFIKLSVEINKLKLKERHSLIDPDKFITAEKVSSGKVFINDFLEELSSLELKQFDVHEEDKIKAVVLEIFEGKIGSGISSEELKELYKLGEKRYAENVPPGYKDKTKTGSYLVGDRELVRKFGDLILWREIINKAKSEKLSSVILVTGDVKEDWWLEKRGKKLGPRKELLNEIYSEAPSVQNFFMYDTANFLRYAKSRLNATVSESSISQAKELIEDSRREDLPEVVEYVSVGNFIQQLLPFFREKKIHIEKSVFVIPPVLISEMCLYTSLVEIFQNAQAHGSDDLITVRAVNREGLTSILFINKCTIRPLSLNDSSSDNHFSYRGYGLKHVGSVLEHEGLGFSTNIVDDHFIASLIIPRSKLKNY